MWMSEQRQIYFIPLNLRVMFYGAICQSSCCWHVYIIISVTLLQPVRLSMLSLDFLFNKSPHNIVFRVVLDSAFWSTICELSNGIFNQVCRIFCSEHVQSTPRSKVLWSGVVTSTWEPEQYFIAKNARNGLWLWRSLYATHVSLEQVDSIIYTV